MRIAHSARRFGRGARLARRPAARNARPGILAEAERRVTARHAEAVRDFLIAEMIDPDPVDIVGFHGQTVIHRPAERFTVQIGDGAQLAQALGAAGGL